MTGPAIGLHIIGAFRFTRTPAAVTCVDPDQCAASDTFIAHGDNQTEALRPAKC